jgi:hypothetical protein
MFIQPSWIAPRYNRRIDTQLLMVRMAFEDRLTASVRFSWQIGKTRLEK